MVKKNFTRKEESEREKWEIGGVFGGPYSESSFMQGMQMTFSIRRTFQRIAFFSYLERRTSLRTFKGKSKSYINCWLENSPLMNAKVLFAIRIQNTQFIIVEQCAHSVIGVMMYSLLFHNLFLRCEFYYCRH